MVNPFKLLHLMSDIKRAKKCLNYIERKSRERQSTIKAETKCKYKAIYKRWLAEKKLNKVLDSIEGANTRLELEKELEMYKTFIGKLGVTRDSN